MTNEFDSWDKVDANLVEDLVSEADSAWEMLMKVN
jgi:hypothetical protein